MPLEGGADAPEGRNVEAPADGGTSPLKLAPPLLTVSAMDVVEPVEGGDSKAPPPLVCMGGGDSMAPPPITPGVGTGGPLPMPGV